MKKWMFVVFPAIFLAIFLAFYFPNRAATEESMRKQAEEVQRAKDADEAKKKAAQEQARISAEQTAAERAKEDAAKEQETKDKWDAASREIQKATDEATRQADTYSKDAAALEIELDTLHKQKEQANRDDFELLKQVELARTSQNAAETEIQRMVGMIASKADDSFLTRLPPPPPPPSS